MHKPNEFGEVRGQGLDRVTNLNPHLVIVDRLQDLPTEPSVESVPSSSPATMVSKNPSRHPEEPHACFVGIARDRARSPASDDEHLTH
jgi:hypothetical protein